MQQRWMTVALAAVLASALTSGAAEAQRIVPGRREVRGLDFAPGGVWRNRVRAVQRARRDALLRGDFAQLNAALAMRARANAPFESALAAAGASTAVTGVLKVPVILLRYADTDTTQSRAPALYDSALFTPVPLTGRPYNVRTYYEEISNGLLSMQGVVIGWITLPGTETFYSGGVNCWGIFCGNMAGLIQEAVARADSAVDWSQFDNDGADGAPNTADDDSRVDLLVLVHATVGAECGGGASNTHIWSHRWYYGGWLNQPPSTTLGTADPSARGGTVRVSDYIVQGGLGGTTGCDGTALMAPGTTAHEAGHGLGLPDLYDVEPSDGDDSEGIGEWGLMGSGNYATATSPAYMEAFSREQLGWITVRPVTSGGTYTLGPVETGDTAFVLRPAPGNAARPNPRGEYFLIENRQRLLSDSGLINKRGGTGGLAIWHIDSAQYFDPSVQNLNTVNSGAIHGVWLMQADGLNQLRSSVQGVRNRGDAGDLFPGTAGVTRLGVTGAASARLNDGGRFAGFIVDSIRQTVPNGEMAMRIRFGGLATVRASDAAAQVRVRGVATSLHRDALVAGDTITIAIDSVQALNAGRSEYVFVSWSDGGARSHVINGGANDTTLVANLAVRHRVDVVVVGGGSVASTPTIPLTGTFVNGGSPLTLTATPAADQTFIAWTGDSVSANPTLVLPMNRPYALTASFVPAANVVNQFLSGGNLLTAEQIQRLDQAGNANNQLDIGDLVAWIDRTGVTLNAELLSRLMQRKQP